MLKKLVLAIFVLLSSVMSFTFAVNTNQGSFGDVDSTSGVGVSGAGQVQGSAFIDSVKAGVNWILGMLGLIALIVLLWGGFQMVTAAGDEEKYNSGFKILKQAAVGLIFIGVSYMLVSLILWIVTIIT